MVKFSEIFLETLRTRVDLVALINQRVPLRKKGREYVACCPFHNEKTPSFTVSNTKGFYHCFGCGAHGSAIDFLICWEKLSFPESVEYLANLCGLPIPHDSFFEKKEDEKQKTQAEALLKIHEEATLFFERKLQTSAGEPARAYLHRRGIREEMWKKFRLGFSPSSHTSLYSHLREKGYSDGLLKESGLVVTPDDTSKPPFDKFRDRLIFPIFNEKNQPIAFGGRLLGPGEPKYLNSPETLIFKKGYELYNLNFSKQSGVKNDPWVIVEGYLDVISLFQGGYEAAVAPLGTALTEHQIAKIWRFCPLPVICFDGDLAGKTASTRTVTRVLPFLKAGYSLDFISLPEAHDPDSFIMTKGMENFRKLIKDEKISLVQMAWQMILETGSFKTPEDKAKIKAEIGKLTQNIQDATIRNFYNSDLYERFAQTQYRRNFEKRPISLSTPLWKTKNNDFLQQEVLLALLIRYPFLIESFEESLVLLELKPETFNNLKKDILEYYYLKKNLENASLVSHLNDCGWKEELLNLSRESIEIHISFLAPQSNQEVCKECDHILNMLKRKQFTIRDLVDAKESLKDTFNESSWQRFQELKKSFNKND